jgi:hypothetical protein
MKDINMFTFVHEACQSHPFSKGFIYRNPTYFETKRNGAFFFYIYFFNSERAITLFCFCKIIR